MARRYDHNRDALMEMAIISGREIIVAGGYSEFSARKVATAIGYTVGTIYNVFGTHDNLILHINSRTLDIWFEDLQAQVNNAKSAPSIEALALYYLEYSATHYNEWSALFAHTLPQGEALPEWYAPKLSQFFSVLEKLVMPFVSHRKKDARRAARVLWAGIHGIAMLSLSGKLDLTESESAKILAKSFVKHYLKGLQEEEG